LPAAICAGVIASRPPTLAPKPSIGTSPIVANRRENFAPQVAPWPQPTIRWPTCGLWPVSDSKWLDASEHAEQRPGAGGGGYDERAED
jgi:hypothetical protein